MKWAIRHSNENAHGCLQRLQTSMQKSLRRASCAVGAFRIGCGNSYCIHKVISQRCVYPVPDQPFDAGRIVTFPLRIDRQRNIRGPAGNCAGRDDNRIAHSLISTTAPIEHSRQHRHVEVGLVVDPDLALSAMQAMEATNALGNCPTPRHRQRQKQSVQAGIIKSLSDASSGRRQYPFFIIGDCRC